MRLIIAGGRDVPDHIAWPFIEAHASILRPTVVLCGMAQGVDLCGRAWAIANGIPVEPYPAAWRRADGSQDNHAGHARNLRMVARAEGLLVIHWAKPRSGSNHVRDAARRAGLFVASIEITQPRKTEP